ncbi:MAG: ImmA/IrrE family metallo-endopeptidase [Planctomycetes bacterium]|nr:ImmA/IrrE family metallo-endopeptidase [Planctomycetota bacterium]
MDTSPARIGERLHEAREAARLDLATLAIAAQIERDRLEAAERGCSLTGLELARAAEVLGLSDVDLAADGPLPGTAVGVLLRGEAERGALAPHLGRLKSIARDLTELHAMLGVENPAILDPFRSRAASQPTPWSQGEALAAELRQFLDLGAAPIRSMRELLLQLSIKILWTEALDESIHGLTLYDSGSGATIVANRRGALAKWWSLRMTLAHELCHQIFDRAPKQPLGRVSRANSSDPVEQRANAFAIYFLAPPAGVERFLRDKGQRRQNVDPYAVHQLMEHFALGKEATTQHLRNLGWIDDAAHRALLEQRYVVESTTDSEFPWSYPPLDRWLEIGVPLERLELIEPALAAYRSDQITLGRLRELLDLDPFVPIAEFAA